MREEITSMDKNLKILHLAPMLQSGAGKVITGLALDGRSHGIESEVVSSGDLNELRDWPEYVDQLRERGIRYGQINLFQRDPEILETSTAWLTGYVSSSEFDLIHAHSGVPAAVAKKALDILGLDVPLVSTFYSWGHDRPAWMDEYDLKAFRASQKITVISSHYRDFLLDHGFPAGMIELIPCGIDPAVFDTTRVRKSVLDYFDSSTEADVIISNLAVIEPRKNQSVAVKALAELPQDSKVRLLCIGRIKDHEYHRELLNLAQDLGVGDRLAFTDFVEDPLPLVAGSDIFLFPSLSEGLGIAILEAMALNVPVIGNPVEGAADLIRDNETALAANGEDFNDIAIRISQLIRDTNLSRVIAENAQKMVRKYYLWSRTVESTFALYKELAARANG